MTKVICFEGVNGIGKDTIINKFVNHFSGKDGQNCEIKLFIEPDNINNNLLIKDEIRRNYNLLEYNYYKLTNRINNFDNNNQLDNYTRLYLFLASRANNYNTIFNDLENNNYDYLILNRFSLSTLTYNKLETNHSLESLYNLESRARNYFKPDITFYLTNSPEIIYDRQLGREKEYLDNNFINDSDILFDYYKKEINKNDKYIKALLNNYNDSIKLLQQKEKQNIVELINDDIDNVFNNLLNFV